MLYLDYSANTPVDEEVLQCFCEAERRYPGNANAHHQAGTTAKAAINEATGSIARCLGAPPAGIIYTSGASEANNLAVKGLAALGGAAGRHILSTRWSIHLSAAVWRRCKSRGTRWSCWTSCRTARWTSLT